jgi:hypothetical protein
MLFGFMNGRKLRLLLMSWNLGSHLLCGYDSNRKDSPLVGRLLRTTLSPFSVGMHGDAAAVVVFMILMIVDGLSLEDLPDWALCQGI